jgi:hypothetical protein
MITGSLTLNGLDDEDMQLIFEMRAKTPLLFNPSGTTIRTKPGVAAKPGHIQAYNNVVMGWTEGSGLAAVMEILKRLNEAHPQTWFAGQQGEQMFSDLLPITDVRWQRWHP